MAESIQVRSESEAHTHKLAHMLASLCTQGTNIVLSGDLGAGKTRFSQGFAQGLGVSEQLASPTFNLVYEYHSGHIPLYHFDVYRLDREDELEDIAFYELVESGGVTLIEWGEKFLECMPEERIDIYIEKQGEHTRNLKFIAHDSKSEEILESYARMLL